MGFFGGSGKSAYQIAVEQGFQGTEEEWVAALLQGPRDTFAEQVEPVDADPGDLWIREDVNG